MNNMQKAIDIINTEYQQIGIDYSNDKDMTVLCFLGKDAETIIMALKEGIIAKQDIVGIVNRYEEAYRGMRKEFNHQTELLRLKNEKLLNVVAERAGAEVRPIQITLPNIKAEDLEKILLLKKERQLSKEEEKCERCTK